VRCQISMDGPNPHPCYAVAGALLGVRQHLLLPPPQTLLPVVQDPLLRLCANACPYDKQGRKGGD